MGRALGGLYPSHICTHGVDHLPTSHTHTWHTHSLCHIHIDGIYIHVCGNPHGRAAHHPTYAYGGWGILCPNVCVPCWGRWSHQHTEHIPNRLLSLGVSMLARMLHVCGPSIGDVGNRIVPTHVAPHPLPPSKLGRCLTTWVCVRSERGYGVA